MKEKATSTPGKKMTPLHERIRQILESARGSAARTGNTTQLVVNWLMEREIVEEEQKGLRQAGYGERLIRDLAMRLTFEHGSGYNLANLEFFRKLYLEYPGLFAAPKGYAPRGQSSSVLVSIGVLKDTLLRVDKVEARAFYEIEAIRNNGNWLFI